MRLLRIPRNPNSPKMYNRVIIIQTKLICLHRRVPVYGRSLPPTTTTTSQKIKKKYSINSSRSVYFPRDEYYPGNLYYGRGKKRGKKERRASSSFFFSFFLSLSLSTRDRGRPLLLRLSLSLRCSVIAPLYRSDMREKSCPYFFFIVIYAAAAAAAQLCVLYKFNFGSAVYYYSPDNGLYYVGKRSFGLFLFPWLSCAWGFSISSTYSTRTQQYR